MTLEVGARCFLVTPDGIRLISGSTQRAAVLLFLAMPGEAHNARSVELALLELGVKKTKREVAKGLNALRKKGLLVVTSGDSDLFRIDPAMRFKGTATLLERNLLELGARSSSLERIVAAANQTLVANPPASPIDVDPTEDLVAKCWKGAAKALETDLKQPMLLEGVSIDRVYVPLLGRSHTADSPPTDVSMMEGEEPAGDFLANWFNSDEGSATLYVLGGPGSGKSTELKTFAARIAADSANRVLYIPMSRLSFGEAGSLTASLGEYVDRVLGPVENPLTQALPTFRYLIVFDGLDELALRGTAGVLKAQSIADQLTNTIPGAIEGVRGHVKVIVSSRTLMFDTLNIHPEQQCLSLRKLYYKMDERLRSLPVARRYEDQIDQRKVMWQNLALATGSDERELPDLCHRPSMHELTDTPLSLNLLFGAFLEHGDILSMWTRASLFQHYLEGVFHRKYEPHRSTINFGFAEFSMALQEAALCSWPRGGKVFPLHEVLERSTRTGKSELVRKVLTSEGNPGPGLILFYIGLAPETSKDEVTLEFTLKPFSDFLISLSIVEALVALGDQNEGNSGQKLESFDLVCSAGMLTPEIREFVKDMLRNPSREANSARVAWCEELRKMQLVLRGRNVGARIKRSRSLTMLLLAISVARSVRTEIELEWVDDTSAAALIQVCSNGGNDEWSDPVRGCLEYLSFDGQDLRGVSLYGCRMSHSTFRGCHANAMEVADMNFCAFTKGHFEGANFASSTLMRADLSGSYFTNASFCEAQLSNTNLSGAWCTGCDFRSAAMDYADLRGAQLASSRIEGARLDQAIVGDSAGREVDFTFAIADSSVLETPVRIMLEKDSFRETTLREMGWSLIEGRLARIHHMPGES